MNRFLIALTLPAMVLFGCSSDHPQQAIKVSGSASVTAPSGEPKVVGSGTKAGARGDPTYTDTEVKKTTTETTVTTPDGTTSTRDVTPTPSSTEIKPVRPIDSTGTNTTK